MVRFVVRKFAILLLLASPAAQAQLWSGPAAVEIQVEDQKGAAVADAELKLQYKAVDPKDGPPAVKTDARGRANVSGLAEGPWQLEVSREGFMTYIAEVNVRTKGRPTLEEALVLASSGALRTMKVRITRGRPAPAPVREPEVSERPTPAPRPTQQTPPRQSEPRPQIQPEPEPSPAPRATPPAPAAPTPKPTPAPPTPAPPAPQPAPQPTTPPAPPARQPVVRPDTETTPPTIPPIHPVRMRSAKDRTCPDCQPGESAMTTEAVVTSGGSGCGSVTSSLKGGVVGELPAGCHVLKVTLPAGAKYSGYRYEIQDGRDSFDCPAGRDCPGSSGRWPVDPVVVKNPEGTVVLAPFEAGSGERERRAVLTVYFKGK
jgi:hypothetical protein